MELNNQQEQFIRQKLTSAVKYQETFDEVFDHVLSAVYEMPHNMSSAEVLTDQVISRDFGGYTKLKEMEKERSQLVIKAIRKKHGQNITFFFTSPAILLIVILAIAGYYFTLNPLNKKFLMGLTTVWAAIPIVFLGSKKLIMKYRGWSINRYQKPSIKERYIFAAAMLSSALCNLLNALNHGSSIYAPAAVLIFVFYTVYVLSFFKLYNQYKVYMAISH